MFKNKLIEFLKNEIADLKLRINRSYQELQALSEIHVYIKDLNRIEELYVYIKAYNYIIDDLENIITSKNLEEYLESKEKLNYHLEREIIFKSYSILDGYENRIKSIINNRERDDEGVLNESILNILWIRERNIYLLDLIHRIEAIEDSI